MVKVEVIWDFFRVIIYIFSNRKGKNEIFFERIKIFCNMLIFLDLEYLFQIVEKLIQIRIFFLLGKHGTVT